MPEPAFNPPSPPPGCAPFRYPADPLQFIAWRDFVVFAIEHPGMRQAFADASGLRLLPPPRGGLDVMIDAATGADKARDEQLVAFIEWLNDAHWGADLVSWQPLPEAVADA